MGGSVSTTVVDSNNDSMMTSSQVAAAMRQQLAAKFQPYADLVEENSLDANLLSSLSLQAWEETLDDLAVTDRLHRRVLTQQWKTVFFLNNNTNNNISADINKEKIISISSNGEENTTSSTACTASTTSTTEEPSKQQQEQSQPPQHKKHKSLRDENLRAAQSFQVTPSTPDSELDAFKDLAGKLMDQSNCSATCVYAGVHLVSKDGHVSLSSRFQPGDGTTRSKRVHGPKSMSICYKVALQSDDEYVNIPFPCDGVTPGLPIKGHYQGHIIKSDKGDRVGMACVVVSEGGTEPPSLEEFLRDIAMETEAQLRIRKTLLLRTQKLEEQIEQVEVVEPAVENLKAVTRDQILQRKQHFPMPEELSDQEDNPRHSSQLPIFQNNHASPKEMSHLPKEFWEQCDRNGIERTPIPKTDMERVAVVQELGLHDLEPDSETASKIRQLTEMATRLFQVPYAEIGILLHDKHYGIVGTRIPDKELWSKFYKFLKFDGDGEPFLCMKERGTSICNYPIHTGQTWVVHDTYKDKSFSYLEGIGGHRFYSGTPLMLNGHAIAVLCLFDWKARPDFGKAQEIQQEQIAQLIVQHIENWSLRRKMIKLERERKLLGSEHKLSPPSQNATLLYTDVEGSTALWEADPIAMQVALTLHNTIVRQCCADHYGYEISSDGDGFGIAFHDPIDATAFSLQLQEKLYSAPWDPSIVELTGGEDPQRLFRGLRVRIALHAGSVDSHKNETTGRMEYRGSTVHIAKSIESMAHGGQILASADVWNVVSYVAVSSLAGPQVVDLGHHVLLMGKSQSEGVIAKGVFQLVPKSLSFDFEAYGSSNSNQDKKCIRGRVFPAIQTKNKLTPSFHDAPHGTSCDVVMAFVSVSEIERIYGDPAIILAALSRMIASFIASHNGYQCKDFMLAFTNLSDAVRFGLKLLDRLIEQHVADVDLSGMVKVGIHQGQYTSMRPNEITGRADYFGKVVNRASRVANVAELGCVYIGSTEVETPDLDSSLNASFVGLKSLKGLSEQLAIYSCSVNEAKR